MNIKKMGRLLSMWAFASVAGLNAKGENYKITKDAMDAIFTQEELSTLSVGKTAVISVNTGWSDTILDGDKKTQVLRAPFIVYESHRKSGFSKAFSDIPEIGAVAVNEDNGRIYAFSPKTSVNFYEIKTGTVTATEPLRILTQLDPQVTTLGFYAKNDESSGKRDTDVTRAISWTDPTNGEFILTYNKDGGKNATIVWHRNGLVNVRYKFSGTDPKNVLKGDHVIYYGNDEKMVSISKSNPNSENSVELRSDRVGLGVVGDTLYQANTTTIYGGEGKLFKPIVENNITTYNESNVKDINGMSSDGKRLAISYSADAAVAVTELSLDKKVPVIAVQGATKVMAAKDGVYAQIKNQMVRVHD